MGSQLLDRGVNRVVLSKLYKCQLFLFAPAMLWRKEKDNHLTIISVNTNRGKECVTSQHNGKSERGFKRVQPRVYRVGK